MNQSLYVHGTMVEDGQTRDLVIVDGVVADASPDSRTGTGRGRVGAARSRRRPQSPESGEPGG